MRINENQSKSSKHKREKEREGEEEGGRERCGQRAISELHNFAYPRARS